MISGYCRDNSIKYSFSKNLRHTWLFSYQIEIIKNDSQIENDISNIFGYQFVNYRTGFCSWDELPKFIREEFSKSIIT